jgi:hypothetical protein
MADVDAVVITEQRIGQGTQVHQVVTVAIVAHQPGSLQRCHGTQPPPQIDLFKSADKPVISPTGESVSSINTVQNTGGETLNNVTVVDDNGTPSDSSDDFTVGTIASLAPNASQTFSVTKYGTDRGKDRKEMHHQSQRIGPESGTARLGQSRPHGR